MEYIEMELPPCTCAECPDHQPRLCGEEAIVKSTDGNHFFCADCLLIKPEATKRRGKQEMKTVNPGAWKVH